MLLILASLISLPIVVHTESAHAWLIGGKAPQKKEFRSTVFINQACTGSKIGPKLFLTAAHCVIDNQTGNLLRKYEPNEYVQLKTHYNFLSHGNVIARTYMHPGYQKRVKHQIANNLATSSQGLVSFDIALIVVKEETPGIPSANVDFEEVRSGEEVVIGGYGCTDSSIKSREYNGFKVQETKVVGAEVISKDALNRDITKAHDFNFYTEGKKSNSQSASICPGDSGGPVYNQRSMAVIGVNSQYIFIDRSGVSFVNTHTRVSEVKEWMTSVAAAAASGKDLGN